MIIDRTVVLENGISDVHFIDDSIQNYIFPEFSPAKHKAEREKTTTTKVISQKVHNTSSVNIVFQNCGIMPTKIKCSSLPKIRTSCHGKLY